VVGSPFTVGDADDDFVGEMVGDFVTGGEGGVGTAETV